MTLSTDRTGAASRPRVAVIGDRGIPARYSGFSTLVEHLALRLVHAHGMDVTVYCRNHYYEDRTPTYEDVRRVFLPAPGGKSFESIIHSNLAILHAAAAHAQAGRLFCRVRQPCGYRGGAGWA